MKQNRKNHPIRSNSSTGFTLVETLVSLILVFMGVVFTARLITFSLDYCKKSEMRLHMQQKIQSESHLLSSKPYEAEELIQGTYNKEDKPYKITWEVSELSPTIKKITLTVARKEFSRRISLFKSKYLFVM